MSKRKPRRAFTQEQIDQIYKERSTGAGVREIARRLNMEGSTVHYWLNKRPPIDEKAQLLKAILEKMNNQPTREDIEGIIKEEVKKVVNGITTKKITSKLPTPTPTPEATPPEAEPILEGLEAPANVNNTNKRYTTEDGYYTAKDAGKRVGLSQGNITRKGSPLSIHAYNEQHPGQELIPIKLDRPKNFKQNDGSITTTKTEVWTPDQWKIFFNWRNAKTNRKEKYYWD